MKSTLSDQPSHYTADLHTSSLLNGSTDKTIKCKSIDAFNFFMGIIENERYADRNQRKAKLSDVLLSTRESWQSDFYKDDYGTDDDN